MARWLRFWLNGGVVDGRRLLSEAMTKEALRPQVTMDDPQLHLLIGAPQFPGYAFGWFVQAFRGKRQIAHGGNIDGMAAMVGFLPDDGVGVVILTNMNQASVTIPLMSHLFDRALGNTPPDYLGDYRRTEERFMASTRRPAATPIAGTRPSLPLEAYAGAYTHPMFGNATVRLVSGRLTVSYDANPNGIGDLEHVQHDAFTATMRDPMLGKVPVTFRVGRNGNVESMAFSLMGATEWMRVPAR
jgi:hypothetical protein